MEEIEAGPKADPKKVIKPVIKPVGAGKKFRKKEIETSKPKFTDGLEAVKYLAKQREATGISPLGLKRRENAKRRISAGSKLVYLAMKINGFGKISTKLLADALHITVSDVELAKRELRNAGLVVSPRTDYHTIEVLGKGDFADVFGEVQDG